MDGRPYPRLLRSFAMSPRGRRAAGATIEPGAVVVEAGLSRSRAGKASASPRRETVNRIFPVYDAGESVDVD